MNGIINSICKWLRFMFLSKQQMRLIRYVSICASIIYLSVFSGCAIFGLQKIDSLPKNIAKGYVEFSPEGGSAYAFSEESRIILQCDFRVSELKDNKVQNLGYVGFGTGLWPFSDASGNSALRVASEVGTHTYIVEPLDLATRSEGFKLSITVTVIEGMITPVKVRATRTGGGSRTEIGGLFTIHAEPAVPKKKQSNRKNVGP